MDVSVDLAVILVVTRNLESRVEVLAPVEPPEARAELRRVLDLQLRDQRAAWDMRPDGSYVQRAPRGADDRRSCQQKLIQLTQEGYERALQMRGHLKRRTRPPKRSRPRREARPRLRVSSPAPALGHKLN